MTTASDLITNAQPGTTWILARDRSKVTLRNKTLWGAATVKGTFSDLEGAGEITPGHSVSGHLHIGAASLATGIKKRDEHLRSADFLAVDEHPVIAVEVHGATVTGADELELDATVTVKNVERRLTLPATAKLLDDGAVRITTHAEINRTELGVDGNLLGMIPQTTRIHGDAVFTPHTGDAS